MTRNSDEFTSVLDAVKSAVPTLRQNGEESEARRWIMDENLELLDKAGVFRMATPRRFGGFEFSLAEQVEVLTEIGRGCPSTGWVASAWVMSSWTATLYPDKAQEEIFANGSVRISIVFAPTGTLVPVEGGYILNGRWKYNSGCQGADWNFNAAMLEKPDGQLEELIAVVPIEELSIIDDWYVTSGSATGSSTSVAKDVFVPAHRVVTLEDALSGTCGNRSNMGATGRNYGLLSLVMAEAAGVLIGIARGAYELFLERLPGKGITYTSWTDQSLHPLTQIQVATAANKISAAQGLSAGWLQMLQQRADAGEEPTPEEKAVVRGQVAFAMQLAKEAVGLLYNASGGSVIQSSVPLQRFHRDIQGFTLHALTQFNVNMELQGRVLLGLDPDTPFL